MRVAQVTRARDHRGMNDRRRVLITGATGGVGLHLVQGLGQEYDLIQHGRTV